MTSPYATQGYPDQDALARMYEQTGRFNQQELDQKYKLGRADIDARLKIAGQGSRDTRYGIEQQRESEREKLALAREDMERIGIPRMLIERYVAEKHYEIASSEMTLKRDMFVEETQQARAKIQLDREQMERIGIPAMEIDRYVAQENAKIQQAQQTGYYGGQTTLAREQFTSDAAFRQAQEAEKARQFNVGATGYMQGPGGGPGQATLERERFGADEAERQRVEAERQRRYGLDVGKFGAELASTPDTYFQARRFQGVDVPRLLGGAGAATTDVAGGPTPGVATMGAYLGGYDPADAVGGRDVYGPQPEAPFQGGNIGYADVGPAPAAGAGPAAGPVSGPGAAPLSAQEQSRFAQLMARDQEIRASGGPGLEGVDLDEAQRFQARGATYQGPGGGGYGSPSPRGGGIGYGGQPVSQAPTSFSEGGGGGIPAMGGDPGTGMLLRTGSSTPYGGSSVQASQGYSSAMPSWYTQQYGGGGGQGSQYPSQDPRQKQVAALVKAMPPSPYAGLSDTDSAALRAMEAIYSGGGQSIAGGEYERLKSSGRLGFLQSAGRMLGRDPKELESQYLSYRPSQGSSRMAG